MSPGRAGKHGWGIAQLVESVGGQPVAEIERDFHRFLPGLTCYFPAVRAGLLAKDHALNIYAFPVCPENVYDLLKLERSHYVEAILRDPATRQIQRLLDKDIRKLAKQQAGDEVDISAPVRITAGDWSGMEGVVVEVEDTTVRVLIELHSRRSVLDLPRNEIQPI